MSNINGLRPGGLFGNPAGLAAAEELSRRSAIAATATAAAARTAARSQGRRMSLEDVDAHEWTGQLGSVRQTGRGTVSAPLLERGAELEVAAAVRLHRLQGARAPGSPVLDLDRERGSVGPHMAPDRDLLGALAGALCYQGDREFVIGDLLATVGEAQPGLEVDLGVAGVILHQVLAVAADVRVAVHQVLRDRQVLGLPQLADPEPLVGHAFDPVLGDVDRQPGARCA